MTEYLNSNLDSLVKKVYEEGVEKGNETAQQIIAAANKQSAEILLKGEQKLARMKEQALNEVNSLKENVSTELKAAVQQTISSIKNELSTIINNKVSLPEINPALHDREFLQNVIATALRKWDPNNTHFYFELLLNKDDEEQLHDFFEQRIKKELGVELEIIIENKIKSGFKIGVKNKNYYVSFTGEDFESFFKGYLRKKTLEWIYGTKQN